MGQRTVIWNGYSQQVVDEAEIGGGWDDVQGPSAQAGGASALTFEGFADTDYFAYFLRHDQNDTLHMSFQMPHSWDMTTPVKPHWHVIPMVAPAVPQDVFIEGAYAWTQVGTVTPLNVGWTTFSNTITIAPTDYLKERIVPLVTVPPLSPPAASDVLLIWARRSGTNLADTYSTNKVLPGNNSSNLCIVSFDCHIYKSRSGTQGEFA